MYFTWDDFKEEVNIEKHGVSFTEAATVWRDIAAMEFFDDEHSENEDRFLKVGYSNKSRVLLVVFCERKEEEIRLISARKATKSERKSYEEGI